MPQMKDAMSSAADPEMLVDCFGTHRRLQTIGAPIGMLPVKFPKKAMDIRLRPFWPTGFKFSLLDCFESGCATARPVAHIGAPLVSSDAPACAGFPGFPGASSKPGASDPVSWARRIHALFSGTSLIQTTPPEKEKAVKSGPTCPPDDGIASERG